MKRVCAGGPALAAVAVSIAAMALHSPTVRAQAGAATQAQTPTFRTGVEYVEVDARVVDGKGKPVRDLKKEDFHLFEDRQEQTIESFSAIDIPLESTSSTTSTSSMRTTTTAPRVEPDVSPNHFTAEESRVYVIVLDDRQIDAQRTQQTVNIVKTFIQRDLGSHDLAAIVATSGRTDISQTLTGNKTLLVKALDGFVGRKLESEAIQRFNGTHPQDSQEWYFEATSSLRAVREVLTWMGGMRGRSKVLLLLSEGTDYNTDNPMSDGNVTVVLDEERQTIAAATRANVTVYGIDPRGLYAFDELTALGGSNAAATGAAVAAAQARERGAGPSPAAEGRSSVGPGAAAWRALNTGFRAEVDRARMSLRSIADETGGAVSFQNDFQAVLNRIVSQHSTYYLLGYYPTNTRRDGKSRSISVKVNGRGLKVLARSGYREAKGSAPPVPLSLPGPRGTSSELREALNSPLPMDGLALTATAAAFRGESGKASIAVIVETPAGNIDVTEQDGKFTGALEIATVAVDRRNVVAAAETTRIDLQLTRETSDQLKRQGFRVLSKLSDVSAGRYQVRAAVVLAGSAKGGSVWYDIDVPDFSKGELVMSGLVIASARQGATPTGNDSKLFAGVLSILPTAVRQFKAGDELLAFAEVYANRTPALEVNLSVIVKDDHAATVIRHTDSISASDFAAADGVYRSVTRLPLADLAPGDYVLSIEATRKADDVRMADRAVPFRVVP